MNPEGGEGEEMVMKGGKENQVWCGPQHSMAEATRGGLNLCCKTTKNSNFVKQRGKGQKKCPKDPKPPKRHKQVKRACT